MFLGDAGCGIAAKSPIPWRLLHTRTHHFMTFSYKIHNFDSPFISMANTFSRGQRTRLREELSAEWQNKSQGACKNVKIPPAKCQCSVSSVQCPVGDGRWPMAFGHFRGRDAAQLPKQRVAEANINTWTSCCYLHLSNKRPKWKLKSKIRTALLMACYFRLELDELWGWLLKCKRASCLNSE